MRFEIDRRIKAFLITSFLFLITLAFPVFATPYIYASEYPEEVYEGEKFTIRFILKVPSGEVLVNFRRGIDKVCLLPGNVCSSDVRVTLVSSEGYGYGYGYSPNFGGEGFVGYGYGYGYLYGFVGETKIIIEVTFEISNSGNYNFDKVKLYFSDGKNLRLPLKEEISIRVKRKSRAVISETRKLPSERAIERKLEMEKIKEITKIIPTEEIRDVKVEKKEEVETITKEVREAVKRKVEEVVKKELKKKVKVELRPLRVKTRVSLVKVTTKDYKSKFFIKVEEFVEKPVIINFPKSVVERATDIIWIKGKVKVIENDPIVEAYPENGTIEYLIEGNNTELVKKIENYEYSFEEVEEEREEVKPKPEKEEEEVVKNETAKVTNETGKAQEIIKPPKKKNEGLLIAISIVVVAIILGVAYYLFREGKVKN